MEALSGYWPATTDYWYSDEVILLCAPMVASLTEDWLSMELLAAPGAGSYLISLLKCELLTPTLS